MLTLGSFWFLWSQILDCVLAQFLAALSLGRVSGFVKDPVHTAGPKIDRQSGICKTLIWKICMYVRGKSTPQIRMMHKKQGRKNSFCFTAWIKSVKLWK